MRFVLAMLTITTLACSNDPGPLKDTTDSDVAETIVDSSTADSASTDSGTDSPAAETDSRADAAIDAPSGEVATGGACAFNRECASTDRCECIDFDCVCRKGVRGTGKNGVDTCTSGNDCASSLCVEGSDGKEYCSDECETAANCGGALPRCLDVTGLGRICVRAAA
jgi:hypothetical protein